MEPVPVAIVNVLAQYGLPGVLALVAIWLWLRKDTQLTEERKAWAAELKAERDARVADAKAYTDQALGLQNKALDVSAKNWEIFNELRTRGGLR